MDSLFVCPRCRCQLRETATQCPKCGTALRIQDGKPVIHWPESELPYKPEQASPFQPPQGKAVPGDTASTVLLIVILVSVFLSLFIAAPGLGITLSILALPALVRTMMVVEKNRQLGRPVSTLSSIGLMLGSIGVTFIVICVTVFAAALTFCLSCIGVFSASTGGGPALFIPVVFTILVTAVLVLGFSSWIRERWRRDTGQK